jgi:hypothetical protein
MHKERSNKKNKINKNNNRATTKIIEIKGFNFAFGIGVIAIAIAIALAHHWTLSSKLPKSSSPQEEEEKWSL